MIMQWAEVEVNSEGNLVFGGCDVTKLIKEYGSPLYVINESLVRKVCKSVKNTLDESGLDGKVYYASKAFINVAICKIVNSEGIGLDVASKGELYTALTAGVDPKDIILHGNNKLPDEIGMAIDNNIGRIAIDGFEEIELIDAIAKEKNAKVNVVLRVKPGIDSHTHKAIRTAQIDSKFGLGITDGQALQAVKRIFESDNIVLHGIHCHIGSQIFESDPYKLAAKIMTDFVVEVKEKTGVMLEEINFGGGFAARYVNDDKPLTPAENFSNLIIAFKEECKIKNIDAPKICIELGRSIIAEAGITAYTVGSIKDIKGVRKYVSVDGGMTDNPRLALYDAKYTAVIANKANEPIAETVSVAGRCCESGDMLIWDAPIQKVEVGDILVVFTTGAYNYSMASNYNRVPVPAVVLVNEGRSEIMVKRQTTEDLLRNDVVPSWL